MSRCASLRVMALNAAMTAAAAFAVCAMTALNADPVLVPMLPVSLNVMAWNAVMMAAVVHVVPVMQGLPAKKDYASKQSVSPTAMANNAAAMAAAVTAEPAAMIRHATMAGVVRRMAVWMP